ALGDPLLELRTRLAGYGFDEVEVAELVDQPAAVPEVPVDGRQLALGAELIQPGLLRDLAQRRLLGRLLALHVTLREPPVLVRVADQQEQHSVPVATEHDPARARFDARTLPRAAPALPFVAFPASSPFSHGSGARRSERHSSRRPCASCPPRSTDVPRSAGPGRDGSGRRTRSRCPPRRTAGDRAPRWRARSPAFPRGPARPRPSGRAGGFPPWPRRRVPPGPEPARTSPRPATPAPRGSYGSPAESSPPPRSTPPRRAGRWKGSHSRRSSSRTATHPRRRPRAPPRAPRSPSAPRPTPIGRCSPPRAPAPLCVGWPRRL